MDPNKAMIEARNDKVAKMQAILNSAKKESRGLTDEEKTQFDALEGEVKGIDDTIARADRVAANYIKKAPTEGPAQAGEVEDKEDYAIRAKKERKEFANQLRRICNATDTPTTPTDGKVMIPTTVWDHIITKVEDICPIYAWADKFNIKGNFVIPVDNDEGNLAVDWAEEFTDLVSGNVKLASIELKGYLAGVLAKISLTLVNNTEFDIVGYVEAKIARKIAKFIEKNLLYGTEDKAEGLSTIGEDMTIESAYSDKLTPDDLIDLQDLVPDQYQENSRFIMHRNTRNAIRKFKDHEGDYMLNRDLTAKWGYMLLGKEVYTSKNMEQIGSGKAVIFYGDFSGLAVKTVESGQIQPLREKYLTQHAIGLVAWLEFDAKIADTEKIAQLVMGDEPAPVITTYTVTYNANGGTGTIDPVEVEAGDSITLDDGSGLTAPEGKEFKGWAKTDSAQNPTVTSPFTPNADVTLYAVYGDE